MLGWTRLPNTGGMSSKTNDVGGWAGGRSPVDEDDFEFHSEPGHLVRRLHQIATSLFLERGKTFGVTPVQYAALNAIGRHSGFEQRDIARLIAIDRTTINIVTRKLEERGLVIRRPLGRAVNLTLSAAGEELLAALEKVQAGHGDEMLTPLSEEERSVFIAMLERLVHHNNGMSRVPMQKPDRRRSSD